MIKVKLFNTPTVEGKQIEEYLGIVTANQVAGTGFFNDFVASFSDFFGGNSGVYRKEMDKLYENVEEIIKAKAKRLGANAIVNVRIDFDNISAKAMSMFMISITGTAVRISGIEDVKESDEISSDDLEYKYRIRDIKDALKESTKLGEERWSFILTNDVQELTPLLYEAYCKNNGYGGDEEETARFETYAEQLDYDDLKALVYNSEYFPKKLIEKAKLMNPVKILEYLESGDRKKAFILMECDKRSYNKEDIKKMREVVDYFEKLPKNGEMIEASGIFGKSKKYKCKCGETNSEGTEYCKTCGKNIMGMIVDEMIIYKEFKKKVEILEGM